MKDKISCIKQMMDNGVVVKSDFLPLVVEFEKEIIDFIDKQNFVYTEAPNIFYRTTDERLSDAKEKEKIAESKPEVVVQENIKDILNCLSNFKERYNIGFIQKATVGNNGLVEVIMPCMINSSFVNDNKISAKLTFDAQIKFLKENGLELITIKNYGIKLKKSENNFNILDTILTQRGATRIKYSVTDDFIDEIKFYVKISDIHKFNEVPIKVEIPVSETKLNQDEILKIKKNLNEILFAQDTILTMDGDIKNTCCSLIQSYFAEISKIVNYDGEIAKIVKERYEEERNKNLMISDIENKVGKILSSEQIVDTINACRKKLDEFAITHFSFYVSEFNIDRYGFVNVKLRYVPSKYCLVEPHKLPSQKYMEDNFDMTLGDRESETLFVLDSTENKSKISEKLKEFCPSSRITNLSVTGRDNSFIINTIELVIDNIANIC